MTPTSEKTNHYSVRILRVKCSMSNLPEPEPLIQWTPHIRFPVRVVASEMRSHNANCNDGRCLLKVLLNESELVKESVIAEFTGMKHRIS